MTSSFALVMTAGLLWWSLLWQAVEERRFFKTLPLSSRSPSNLIAMTEGLIVLAIALVLPMGAELKSAAILFGAAGLLIDRIHMRWRFRGPLSGGSDSITLLALTCATLAAGADVFGFDPRIGEIALAYLGLQAVLSYVMAGLAKLKSSDWRSGRLLHDIAFLSPYPVPPALQNFLRDRGPSFLKLIAWTVLIFELSFAFVIFDLRWLLCWLALAFAFHFLNALVLGLNRFTWAWLAAYPAIVFLASKIQS